MDADTLQAFDDAVAARGDTVTELDGTQIEAFRDLMATWHDDWINGADDPAAAQAIYDDALALAAAS